MLASAQAQKPFPSLAASRLDTIHAIASIDLRRSRGTMRSTYPGGGYVRAADHASPVGHAHPVAPECPHPFQETDPTDRRQHPAVRLHHAGADRRGGDDPGRPRPRGRGDTPRPDRGALSSDRALERSQKRAYVLADNKLALNAGWDEDLLAAELGALLATDLDLDLDIGVTGFSIPEVDDLLATVTPEEPDDPADEAVPATAPARVRRGEVWQLGAHRLICGDVRDPAVLATLMAGEQVRMVFTDPPYNVPIDGHAGGLGRITHREFAMAAGEMSREAFTAFLQQALAPLAAHSVEGSIHYVCMDWRHLP